MAKNVNKYRPPTGEEIAICARLIYETEGRPEGRAMEHWLQAEAILIAERKADAGLLEPAATESPKSPTTGGSKTSSAPAAPTAVVRPATTPNHLNRRRPGQKRVPPPGFILHRLLCEDRNPLEFSQTGTLLSLSVNDRLFIQFTVQVRSLCG